MQAAFQRLGHACCACYDRKTILRELTAAGFIDVQEQDVGTSKLVAFIIAKKPA